ncbi:hypothetical protein ACFYVL_42640 [Streptomyces sp. NPDC004111]|uniref:hypothetical protein n=1 Tax=Streptomyces sp. NPDC004111 TaxID=3364690 RepID=UPI00368A913F
MEPPEAVLLEITSSTCPRCHADVDGINGRYACTLCNWVNHWTQGHTTLPTADGQLPDTPPTSG